jgi:probable HAF family extracellular repeat protein
LNDHAFRWVEGATDGVASNPEMSDLDTLGGRYATAYGVNAEGSVVVGESDLAANQYGLSHAVRWVEGAEDGVAANPQMFDLGALGGRYSTANAVSADGRVVVGSSEIADEDYRSRHAFYWREGGTDGPEDNPQMQDLGTLTGKSWVRRERCERGWQGGFRDQRRPLPEQ